MNEKESDKPEEEPEYIVCLSVNSDLQPVPGSTITNCVECDDRLWIAPSTDSVVSLQPHLEPICFSCAGKKGDGITGIEQSTKEQMEEVLRELKRRKMI